MFGGTHDERGTCSLAIADKSIPVPIRGARRRNRHSLIPFCFFFREFHTTLGEKYIKKKRWSITKSARGEAFLFGGRAENRASGDLVSLYAVPVEHTREEGRFAVAVPDVGHLNGATLKGPFSAVSTLTS